MEYKDCPLCYNWDCECEDILTPEEYQRLVKEEKKKERRMVMISITMENLERSFQLAKKENAELLCKNNIR